MAPLEHHPKTKFPTVYRRYTSQNENFEYSYPLIVLDSNQDEAPDDDSIDDNLVLQPDHGGVIY